MSVDVSELLRQLGVLLVILLAAGVLIGALAWWFLVRSSELPHARSPLATILWLALLMAAPIVGLTAWAIVSRIDAARQREALRGRTWTPRPRPPGDGDPRP